MSNDRGKSLMGFYESIAGQFDAIMNPYDLETRLRVVYSDLLGGVKLDGLLALDAGCGTGRFSAPARGLGARVVSLDYSFSLTRMAATRGANRPLGVQGDALMLPFGDATFDLLVSSELVEHTTDPILALRELVRVLKPGGLLALTTPNWVWRWSLNVAKAFGIRAYHGNENWLTRPAMRRILKRERTTLLKMTGFHLLPFQLPAFQWIDMRTDRFGRLLGPLMINMAVLARRDN